MVDAAQHHRARVVPAIVSLPSVERHLHLLHVAVTFDVGAAGMEGYSDVSTPVHGYCGMIGFAIVGTCCERKWDLLEGARDCPLQALSLCKHIRRTAA